jgi:hypothetical protein
MSGDGGLETRPHRSTKIGPVSDGPTSRLLDTQSSGHHTRGVADSLNTAESLFRAVRNAVFALTIKFPVCYGK